MKQLSKILFIATLIVGTALQTQAQTLTLSTKYASRNNDEHIAQVLVTTDSTPVYIDSLQLSTNQLGIAEVTVIGYAKDTAYGVVGVIKVPFTKRRDALSVGTIVEDVPITRAAILTHTNLGGATFTAVAVNNNLYIRVKGVTDVNVPNIRWYAITKLKSQQTVLK